MQFASVLAGFLKDMWSAIAGRAKAARSIKPNVDEGICINGLDLSLCHLLPPAGGAEHELSPACWCKPVQNAECMWVHCEREQSVVRPVWL